MATPAQAAAATVGAGSLAAAGAYGITYATSGDSSPEDQQEPDNSTLPLVDPEPSGVVTFPVNQNLDGDYSSKLLSVTKKSNLSKIVKPLEETTNKVWWDWAFKNKFSKKIEGKVDPVFSFVTTGFLDTETADDKTSLNHACDKAYKKEKTEYKFGDEDYLLQNISLFCTTGLTAFDISEPEATVFNGSDEGTYSNKLAGVPTNKPKLVKPTGGENEYWWKWAYKNRFPTDKSGLSTVFASVDSAYDTTDNNNPKKKLNHACDEAYKKDNAGVTGNNDKVLENTKQFCTLTGKDILAAPTQ